MEKDKKIVVGICTKNCEDTVQNVIEVVDKGLREFFPQYKASIIVSDLSDDSTEEVVRSTKTYVPLIFRRQEGGPGKGNGVKTIFKFFREIGGDYLALVDGDLLSIKPEWIKYLVEPLIEGFDLVVPYYERHKYDAVITNHIVYPFVASLYGKEIRQPIGGEFSLSRRLVEVLLNDPQFPAGFGIDIFITTSALAHNMKVAEAKLGVKNHASTRGYQNFEKSLIPMFNHVVSTLFRLTFHHMEKIKDVSRIEQVERFGNVTIPNINESKLDEEYLYSSFVNQISSLLDSDVFSSETRDQLKRVVDGEGLISIDVWSDVVFDVFNYYVATQDMDKALMALRPVWMGRLASYIKQTQYMNNSEAECLIKCQVNVFKEKRDKIFGERLRRETKEEEETHNSKEKRN